MSFRHYLKKLLFTGRRLSLDESVPHPPEVVPVDLAVGAGRNIEHGAGAVALVAALNAVNLSKLIFSRR